MDIKRTILGTVAYTAVTFPIAVIWHVVLFKERYQEFGYLAAQFGIFGILIGLIYRERNSAAQE